jgi:hypothetical protein
MESRNGTKLDFDLIDLTSGVTISTTCFCCCCCGVCFTLACCLAVFIVTPIDGCILRPLFDPITMFGLLFMGDFFSTTFFTGSNETNFTCACSQNKS